MYKKQEIPVSFGAMGEFLWSVLWTGFVGDGGLADEMGEFTGWGDHKFLEVK
jgi:hypothetical protein